MGTLKKIKKYKWLIRILLKTPFSEKKRLLKGFKERKKYYTSPYENFSVNVKELAKCALCPNMCRFDCPAVLASKKETHSPANKARIAFFMSMGKIDFSNPSAIDTLYACMDCNACQQWCPMSISVGDLLIQMRQSLEQFDLIPQKYRYLAQRIKDNGSIFESNPFTALLKNKKEELFRDNQNPDIFYFVGCMSAKYRNNMVRANLSLFSHFGLKVSMKLDQRTCCGSPIAKTGMKSLAKKLAQETIDLIYSTRAKIIVSDCPSCAYMIEKTYREMGIEHSLKVYHTSQFFIELMQRRKITPSHNLSITCSYHDPCVLARRYDEEGKVTSLLERLPGVVLKMPYLSGKETRCCGYGGVYHVSFSDFSDQLTRERFDQLTTSDQECIVSACPTCEFAFEKASHDSKRPSVSIKDFSEILADSLGITY